jgi:flagellin-like hook-associated protein FlgL
LVSRISNPIIINTAIRNLQTSLKNLQESQEIISTGLKIRRPSDDPLGAATALRLRAEIIEINRFVANIDRAESFVNATEGAFGTVNEILLTLREIAVTESNDTSNANARAAAAFEVDAIIEQLLQTANSDYAGRRIFAGHQTETIPFVDIGTRIDYRGDDGLIYEEIGPNNVIEINIPGNVAFGTFIGQVIGDVDLDPDISTVPAFDTPLAQLNGGNGVQPGSIVITDGSGASATIDLSAAVTISDVVAAINAAAAIDVTASINNDGNGLLITDNTVSPALPLTIAEDPLAIPATTTAADLGILGSEMGSIRGTDLDPVIVGTDVTAATLLADVNFGGGVDQVPGTFDITDRDGNTVTVDVSAAVTVGDVVTAINALTGPGFNVSAAIAGDGSGIELTDTISTGRTQITVAEVGGSTASDLGLLGTGVGTTLHGARLDPAGLPSTPVSLLAGGTGLTLGVIRITNGDLTASIDLSGAVTVGNVLAAIERAGVRVDATVDTTGTRLVITSQTGDTPIVIVSEGIENSAEDLGIFAPGIFETADEVRQALRDNDPQRLTQLIANVDDAISHIIDLRAGTGQQDLQISFARERLRDLELSFDALRSRIEEADLTEFATELVNHQTIYQAALETTIRVIQPTIFSFLG